MSIGIIIFCLMVIIPMEGRAVSNNMSEKLTILFPSGNDLLTYKFQGLPLDITVEKPGTSLQFTIPIPNRDWYRVNEEAESKGIKRLATFISPKGRASGLIEVLHHQLDLEVDSQDWLKFILSRNKVKIMATREEKALMGQLSEAVGVAELPKDSKEDPTVFRVAVYRSGQSLIIIRCSASAPVFLDLAYYFAATTHMFQLKNPQPEVLVGKWAEHCLKGNLCYRGPEKGMRNVSWPERPIEEQAFEIMMLEKPAGRLHIKTILPPVHAKTTALKRIDVLLESMAKDKFKFTWDGKAVRNRIVGVPGDAYFMRAIEKGRKMDLLALSLESPSLAVLVWTMTPDSETNPDAWMHNKRVFEIVCSSLRIKK